VKSLLGLEAEALMRRLEARRGQMIGLFSRHRDREALLWPLRSSLPSAGFSDLAQLEPAVQRAASAFCEELDELRWYFQYTEDMPQSAQGVFNQHLTRLRTAWGRLSAALGTRGRRGRSTSRAG